MAVEWNAVCVACPISVFLAIFFFNGDTIVSQNPYRLNTQMIKLCLCTLLNRMAFSQVEASRVLLIFES